jgi:hypothetical protein
MRRVDHDQRFKTLIQTFFAEFLLLFFKSKPMRSVFGNFGLSISNIFTWAFRHWMR